MELAWKQFNALGTEIVIAAHMEQHEKYLLDKAQAQVFEFEQRFSRFIGTSELSALNNASGTEYQVSEMLADILLKAKKYYQETGGLFDPVIIDILEGFGYDKPFADAHLSQLTYEQAVDKRGKAKAEYGKRPKFDDLIIQGQTLKLPKGFRLDLGGIGKGYVADLIGREIFKDIENFWVSAGGDLLVRGNDGDKSGWRISVQNPMTPEKESFAFNTLGMKRGVATSGVAKRQGIAGGLEWNHIIDPRNGEPVDNDVVSVTIIAATAEQADVYAKTALLQGVEGGMLFIEKQPDVEGAIFLKNKTAVFSSGLAKYL